MGCTPSKSTGIYSQERVCRDLDTCSTFVPSQKSSVSPPERPRLCVETSSGKQTFLNVPYRDVHERSGDPSLCHENWSSAGSAGPGTSSCAMARSPTRDLHSATGAS
ncbi:uncharacterized protein PAE49_013643 [Odontesthes bonariensis]